MKVRGESSNKRKIQTTRPPLPIPIKFPCPIPMLDAKTHRESNVQLMDIRMEATPVTLFDKSIFGKTEVLLDLYQYFGNEVNKNCIQAAIKDEDLTHEEMASTQMLEVKVKYFISIHCNMLNLT